MGNPSFEPILGSSFDNIGAQRFQWANANTLVDSANINRMNEADQARNAWEVRNQQIAQQQADAQDKADEEAQRFAEGQRQFDVGTQTTRMGIQRSKDEEAARTALYGRQLDKQNADAAAYASTVDEVAKTKSQDADAIKNAAADARKAFYDATAQVDTAAADQQSKNKNIAYDKNAKGFVPRPQFDVNASDDDKKLAMTLAQQAAQDANTTIAKVKADYDTAKAEHLFHQSQAADFEKNLEKQYGLLVRHNGDKWEVYNPANKKAYSGTAAAAVVPNRFTPVMGARQMADDASMNRFSQPATTVAAATTPQPSYIAGRRYGNLRYIGGDPNDQNHWLLVQ